MILLLYVVSQLSSRTFITYHRYQKKSFVILFVCVSLLPHSSEHIIPTTDDDTFIVADTHKGKQPEEEQLVLPLCFITCICIYEANRFPEIPKVNQARRKAKPWDILVTHSTKSSHTSSCTVLCAKLPCFISEKIGLHALSLALATFSHLQQQFPNQSSGI